MLPPPQPVSPLLAIPIALPHVKPSAHLPPVLQLLWAGQHLSQSAQPKVCSVTLLSTLAGLLLLSGESS